MSAEMGYNESSFKSRFFGTLPLSLPLSLFLQSKAFMVRNVFAVFHPKLPMELTVKKVPWHARVFFFFPLFYSIIKSLVYSFEGRRKGKYNWASIK